MMNRIVAIVASAGGFILAVVLSYYMNIRFDHKTVLPFLAQKLKSRTSSTGNQTQHGSK